MAISKSAAAKAKKLLQQYEKQKGKKVRKPVTSDEFSKCRRVLADYALQESKKHAKKAGQAVKNTAKKASKAGVAHAKKAGKKGLSWLTSKFKKKKK